MDTAAQPSAAKAPVSLRLRQTTHSPAHAQLAHARDRQAPRATQRPSSHPRGPTPSHLEEFSRSQPQNSYIKETEPWHAKLFAQSLQQQVIEGLFVDSSLHLATIRFQLLLDSVLQLFHRR